MASGVESVDDDDHRDVDADATSPELPHWKESLVEGTEFWVAR